MQSVLNKLDDKDRVVLLEAIGSEHVTSAAIAAVLLAEGHDIKANTLSRHRRGDCCCER